MQKLTIPNDSQMTVDIPIRSIVKDTMINLQ